jgi:hypothetical protein
MKKPPPEGRPQLCRGLTARCGERYLAILLLVTILAQALLPLVSSNLVSFTLTAAGHRQSSYRQIGVHHLDRLGATRTYRRCFHESRTAG